MAGDGAEGAGVGAKVKVKKRKRSLSTGAADVSPAAGKRQKVASDKSAKKETPKKAKKADKAAKDTTPKTPRTPKVKKTKKATPSTPLGAATAQKAQAGAESATKPRKKRRSSLVTEVEQGDQGASSCLSEKKVTLRLHLLPQALGAMKQSILHVLMDFLMKYNTALGGVVLSFSDVVIPKKDAAVLSDFPHMHFSLRCKMAVFTPTLGTYLHGVVSQVGFDHVGVLVFGHFNASIAADSMPSTYERDSEEDQWVCTEDPSVRLVRGSVVRFRVSGVHLAASGSFSIAGDLTAPGSRPLGIIEEVPEVFHVEAMEVECVEEENGEEEEAAGDGDVEMAEAEPEAVKEEAGDKLTKETPVKAEKAKKKKKKKKAKKAKESDGAADTPKTKKKKKKRPSTAAAQE